MADDRRLAVGRQGLLRYDAFLKRGAAVNCGIGVAIGLTFGVQDGVSVVLLAALGLMAASCLLRVVDACADFDAVIAGRGRRDAD